MRQWGEVGEYTVGFKRVGCESGMTVGRESGVIEWGNSLFLYKYIKYLWIQIHDAGFKRYIHRLLVFAQKLDKSG